LQFTLISRGALTRSRDIGDEGTISQPNYRNMTDQQLPTATQRKPKPSMTLRDHLESPGFAQQMAKVLPQHLTPERMARVAATAMTRIPKLAQCDQASFFSAMLTLSQIGLEPDGRLAHLIPYGTTCQLIIDWKGLAQLAYRSGMVSTLHADVIHAGDLFEYDCGEIAKHVPHFLRVDSAKPKSAGEVVGAYAIAKMKDGSKMAVVLSEEEIDGIRKRSKAASSGPWVTDRNEMRKKTAFRRLSKWLPLESEKYRDALDADDASDPINVTPQETVTAARFTAEPERIEPAGERAEPVEDAPAKSKSAKADPRADLLAIITAQGCDQEDFLEAITIDGTITQAEYEAFTRPANIADVATAIVFDYLGADGTGARAIAALKKVVEAREKMIGGGK